MNKPNKKNNIHQSNSRDCFLYGICTRNIVNKHHCAEEISRFGLRVLNGQCAR